MDYIDYERKEEARNRVWNVIDHYAPMEIKDRRVMILECGQAGEIVHLLRRGYRPENIHAVNWQRQQIAGIAMRLRKLGLPQVNTHVGDLLHHASIIRPDVINYDGCGPMGAGDTDNYTKALLWQLQDGGVMNITHLVGRDQNKTLRNLIKMLGAYDARMVYMTHKILKDARPTRTLRVEQLPGRTLNMLYTIVQVTA